MEAAQGRWRTVNAPRMVALVRARAVFEKGRSWNDQSTRAM